MSKHRVAVIKVVTQRLSVTAAAAEYGVSRQHLHRLLRVERHLQHTGGLVDRVARIEVQGDDRAVIW
jgi:hypothetical protein